MGLVSHLITLNSLGGGHTHIYICKPTNQFSSRNQMRACLTCSLHAPGLKRVVNHFMNFGHSDIYIIPVTLKSHMIITTTHRQLCRQPGLKLKLCRLTFSRKYTSVSVNLEGFWHHGLYYSKVTICVHHHFVVTM